VLSKMIFLKRFFRRLRFAFHFKEMYSWPYESCDRCGHLFKLLWSASDKKWEEVTGSENGCLCVSCFIEKANEKNISINSLDITRLEVFNPKEK